MEVSGIPADTSEDVATDGDLNDITDNVTSNSLRVLIDDGSNIVVCILSVE